jgi:hypothetical protein
LLQIGDGDPFREEISDPVGEVAVKPNPVQANERRYLPNGDCTEQYRICALELATGRW